MDGTDAIVLRNEDLEAHITRRGAELVRLVHRTHGDLLWTADPAYWNATSPILFPVIGRSPDGLIRVDGVDYPMPSHGFAASSEFGTAQRDENACALVLTEDEHTLAAYPFRFALRLDYRLEGTAISCAATVSNPGDGPLPASFGFHPGFRWPLPQNAAKAGHEMAFPDDDWLDSLHLREAALAPELYRLPLEHHKLALVEELFARSAQIVPAYRSRTIRYRGAGGGPEVVVTPENLPQLGLWMRPGAPFICIEPWHGLIAPVDFTGELRDRPGGFVLAPGEERRFTMTIAVHDTTSGA